MKNITILQLGLKKAGRNLQDYLKITYMDGIISGTDQRYVSIWRDYQQARKDLIKIDNEFFSSLDVIALPEQHETRSFFDRDESYSGFPAGSRDTINVAIENALSFIQEYERINDTQDIASDSVFESANLIIQIMSNWSNMIASFEEHRKDITPIQVTNEYEMQYLLEGVLRLLFDDVRPETYTPNYANKSNRTDFLLPKERILIETKMTREGLNDIKLSEELIIDKEHYRKHPDVDVILCVSGQHKVD